MNWIFFHFVINFFPLSPVSSLFYYLFLRSRRHTPCLLSDTYFFAEQASDPNLPFSLINFVHAFRQNVSWKWRLTRAQRCEFSCTLFLRKWSVHANESHMQFRLHLAISGFPWHCLADRVRVHFVFDYVLQWQFSGPNTSAVGPFSEQWIVIPSDWIKIYPNEWYDIVPCALCMPAIN